MKVAPFTRQGAVRGTLQLPSHASRRWRAASPQLLSAPKIDKRRKEKEDEKKKREETGGECSEEDSVDEKGREASEAEDENSDDEKEESYSESESSKDGNEQVTKKKTLWWEEESLQSALKDSKKDQQTREGLVDEMEKKKAAEFFEADPFAARNFCRLEALASDHASHFPYGFEKPTPIQLRAIPIALTGKDICASAQTGSGKTAAFLLPILEVSVPLASCTVHACDDYLSVRELATQCQSMLEQLARFTDITCSLAVGGLPLKAQEAELRNRPDVVVCTPGRMIDHLRNSKNSGAGEADRLLELGFTEEVLELVRMCPVQRQTMLFSATMTSKVDQLIDLSMKRPVRISTDPLFDMAKHLVQEFVRIRPNREDDREAILLALCTRTFRSNTIVFMETKSHAHRMMIIFGLAGIKAAELHGNLHRGIVWRRFRSS
ncbi:P-loop containing nucleoside triphosphate hydrolase [Phytophthora cactorum]|nr:P-loop containing nucleoside triphosphate hydrolase [Phytophthora cactorum]